jgi:hypothetical protein
MTTVNKITDTINKHLQKNVEFVVENKTIKSGKVLLFSIKDFFCCFLLFNESKKKRFLFEIPYPFSFSEEKNELIFDYTLNTFSSNNPTLKVDLLKFRNKKPCKLFNKKVRIKINV